MTSVYMGIDTATCTCLPVYRDTRHYALCCYSYRLRNYTTTKEKQITLRGRRIKAYEIHHRKTTTFE